MRSERSGETTVRVLVVEDEKGLAESMRRGLVAEGFVVDVVHDGVSGLWAASEFSSDVAILDIMLPRLNGYDVLKQIRDRNIWTPVIMLTAWGIQPAQLLDAQRRQRGGEVRHLGPRV